MYNQVLLVAPAGGSISGAAVSNGTGEFVQSTLYGHEVWVGGVNLYAQESATVTYSVTVTPAPPSPSAARPPGTGLGARARTE